MCLLFCKQKTAISFDLTVFTVVTVVVCVIESHVVIESRIFHFVDVVDLPVAYTLAFSKSLFPFSLLQRSYNFLTLCGRSDMETLFGIFSYTFKRLVASAILNSSLIDTRRGTDVAATSLT